MDSRESAGSAGELYASISARVMELAVQRGIEAGVGAAMEYIDAERKASRKGRYDRRLHNTRLLLKNYRLFKKHAEGAIFNVKQAKERAVDILEGIDDYAMDDELYIESIKKSQQRTIVILQHIDQMLNYYRIDCEQSHREDEIRRYRIVMATYIDDEKKSALEISEKECIERRTLYKDINIAMKPLTALFFGIDSMKTV